MQTIVKLKGKAKAACLRSYVSSTIKSAERSELIVMKTPLLSGVVKAPPSKSYTQRAIIIGSLNGDVKIVDPLLSDDSLAAMKVWNKLGAKIDINEDNNTLHINGVAGHPQPQDDTINVNESGTLLRFILPILALAKGNFTITGQETLMTRSNRTIVEALRNWDIDVNGKGDLHKLPITIKGVGKIRGGKTVVSGKEGSQVVSSLLIAASWAQEDTTVIVKDGRLASRPYVDITIDALKKAGIHIDREGYRKFTVRRGQDFNLSEDFVIPGDYSSAAFLIAASCLVQSDVTITNLQDDAQGDKRIITILNRMGAKIKHDGDSVRIQGPFELKGIDIDGSDIPDIVPMLTAVACFAKGKTRIKNIAHLSHKESDRIISPAGELRKLGAKITTDEDSIIISHSNLKPGTVSACKDHRIAMMLTVIGLRIGDIKVTGTKCITKSYPDFLQDIESLGANINSF